MSLRTLAALVACLTLPALGEGQGLGAAAAKERQRRGASGGQAAKPAKAYTEDDLKSLPPVESPGPSSAAAATVTSAEAAASGSAAAQDDAGASEERTRAEAEARWRERAAAARARIEQARADLEYLEGLHLVPGVRYVDEKGATVIGSVEQLQGMTRRARAELAAAEKALEDLQDEARRASVPPGWLR